MEIYTVKSGDTLSKIAKRFGINVTRLATDNGIQDADRLAVGENLLVVRAAKSHTVAAGDTLDGIARRYRTDIARIWQYNPQLFGKSTLSVGETVLIEPAGGRESEFTVAGYANADTPPETIAKILPYLTVLSIGNATLDRNGGIRAPIAESLVKECHRYCVAPLLHIVAGKTPEENRAVTENVLQSEEYRESAAASIVDALEEMGYAGCELELCPGKSEEAFRIFLNELRGQLSPRRMLLFVTVPDNAAHAGAAEAIAENEKIVRVLTHNELPTKVGPILSLPQLYETLTRIGKKGKNSKLLIEYPCVGIDYRLPYRSKSDAEIVAPGAGRLLAIVKNAEIGYENAVGSAYFSYEQQGKDGSVRNDVYFPDIRAFADAVAVISRTDSRGIYLYTDAGIPTNFLLLLSTAFRIRKFRDCP